MKKLLIICSLLSVSAYAQEKEQTVNLKNEMGLTMGLSFNPVTNFTYIYNAERRFSLSYLCNFSKTQTGLSVEAGINGDDYGYISPMAILNRKLAIGRSYFFVGGALGYYFAQSGILYPAVYHDKKGYVFGVQGGAAIRLSKHISFTTEVGVRSTQVWYKVYNYYPLPLNSKGVSEYYGVEHIDSDFYISFPAAIGIRYRF